MSYNEDIDMLAKMLKKYSPAFAFTGAGVSTESGIPDFRSPGTGQWTKTDPFKTASLSALRRNPAEFYRLNLDRWATCAGARPNDCHRAMAALEKKGHLVGVITQNIDGLHISAGSARVWEVHGHLRTCHCMECNASYPFRELEGMVRSGKNPPLCPVCGGVLRPDVVLFEDAMSMDFYNATEALKGSQLLLVVGSSLQVYPAASLPGLSRRLVIINREMTQWDERADLVIHRLAGEVFRDLLSEMGYSLEP